MHDILSQLYEYDQNLLAHAPLGQSPYRANGDNNSEMNYANEFPLERGQGKYIKDSDSQMPPQNSAAILATAPTKKAILDPIGGSRKSPFHYDVDNTLDTYNQFELQSHSSPQLNTSVMNQEEIILDPNYQGS